MKVSDSNQRIQLDAYIQNIRATQNQDQMQQQVNKNESQKTSDQVELSQDSRLLQKIDEMLSVPDPERTAKVQFLKDQVKQGTYEIDAEKVAGAMMKDLIKDLG